MGISLADTMLVRRGKEDNTKRQRTSGPSSSPSDSKTFAPNAHSEDEEEKAPKPEGANKIRGAAARNHRAKEFREREAAQQREQERADAAGRRKARSERRRGEGQLSSAPSTKCPTRLNSSHQIPIPQRSPSPVQPPTKTRHNPHPPSPNPPTKRPVVHPPAAAASDGTNTPKIATLLPSPIPPPHPPPPTPMAQMTRHPKSTERARITPPTPRMETPKTPRSRA